MGNVCTENVEKPPTDFTEATPKDNNLLYGTREESNDLGLSMTEVQKKGKKKFKTNYLKLSFFLVFL